MQWYGLLVTVVFNISVLCSAFSQAFKHSCVLWAKVRGKELFHFLNRFLVQGVNDGHVSQCDCIFFLLLQEHPT